MDYHRAMDRAIRGNAHDDRHLLDHQHQIAVNEDLPIHLRLRALNQIDHIMGVVCPYPNENDLADYMEASADFQ